LQHGVASAETDKEMQAFIRAAFHGSEGVYCAKSSAHPQEGIPDCRDSTSGLRPLRALFGQRHRGVRRRHAEG
jgi:hypothetical protein